MSNSVITAGRNLPWLQDVDSDGDGQSDVFLNSWPVEYRDVAILDKNNVKVDVYNLTSHDLKDPANYATMKAKLVAAAEAAKGSNSTFSWTNSTQKLDVNNDTFISPLDALLVLNELNTVGGHALGPLTAAPPAYLDTNQDNFVSPLDALLVINHLNAAAAAASAAAAVAAVPATPDPAEGEPVPSEPAATPAISDSALMAAAIDAVWESLAENRERKTNAFA